MIDSQYYEAQCYIRGTSLAAAYHYTNGAKSDYTYYVQNAHGDVVNLTDADGAVTKTYHYDAFGVERNINVADTNAFRYCGEYYDAETGTIYLRARYYDPSIGRFTQRDTVVGEYNDPLSLNLYTYCQNNPVLGCDPTGHAWYHWAIGAAIVVGLAALTIASAGTFALGMAAIGTAAAGASVGGATGVFAAATVASGTALAGSAMYASLNSESLQDFNEQGDWGVVAGVAGSGMFAGSMEYAQQRWQNRTPKLPKYDGKTTHAVLVTGGGKRVKFTSGGFSQGYRNYIAASHTEGKGALYMRANNISFAKLYHNNPKGTCNYCNNQLPSLLAPKSTLTVIPPENAKAPNRYWFDYPKTYVGNDRTPKLPD